MIASQRSPRGVRRHIIKIRLPSETAPDATKGMRFIQT